MTTGSVAGENFTDRINNVVPKSHHLHAKIGVIYALQPEFCL